MNRRPPKIASHQRGKTHDGENHVGKLVGTIRSTRKARHRAERRTAAPQIADELRDVCPGCGGQLPCCPCTVAHLSAIAEATVNHERRIEEFRYAATHTPQGMRIFDLRDGELRPRESYTMSTPEKMAEVIASLDPFQKVATC